jgi:hypothetical protein
MKKLFLAAAAAGLSLVASSHTESEKIEVARRMARFVHMSTSYDNIDETLANYREWSRPEVFFGINVNGWTVDEKDGWGRTPRNNCKTGVCALRRGLGLHRVG